MVICGVPENRPLSADEALQLLETSARQDPAVAFGLQQQDVTMGLDGQDGSCRKMSQLTKLTMKWFSPYREAFQDELTFSLGSSHGR